jgi:hypothetical protein
MKRITLHNLHCTDTEDWGDDECRLEIYTDGELYYSYRRDMSDGDDWPLDQSMLFERNVVIKLFDDDNPWIGDDHDALGTVRIPAAPVAQGIGRFTQDGADYTLTYSVVDAPAHAGTDLTQVAIQQFSASTAAGMWPNFDKATILAEVQARVANPYLIRQHTSSFCGPTSIAFELARTQPRRYVRFIQHLWETGGIWTRTSRVEASQGLRNSTKSQSMSQADWMLIATMRESENALFPVSGGSTGVANGIEGMSTHWEIEGWVGEILLKDNTYSETTFVWGEFDTMTYADQVFAAGGSAFLMIHTDMLPPYTQARTGVLVQPSGTVPPWPTHFITYLGGLQYYNDGTMEFYAYSWGDQYRIRVTTDHFENCMFGIVTGF